MELIHLDSQMHTRPAREAGANPLSLWDMGGVGSLDFDLPDELEAGEPPEARGLSRDQVRLMVTYLNDNRVVHTQFRKIIDFLAPGDLLVVNTSGTMNASLPVKRADGSPLDLHLSTHLPGDLWTVELRLPRSSGSEPFYSAQGGETLSLPGGATAHLLVPYHPPLRGHPGPGGPVRLWIAELQLPSLVDRYLQMYGDPIRYKYVRDHWPLEYYQTVFTTVSGSAEMPSAGRAFSRELVASLTARGVQFAPLVLHTGVASLGEGEPPYEEYYQVPPATAQALNKARRAGNRRLAVGTTVLRALETVTAADGVTHPGEGWTGLVITPDHTIRSADGILTGLHEPRSSHLAMLSALAGFEHLQIAYAEALQEGYLWHEFGDLHLILSN
jgi:S-adenosylmethionine:tRNA ribosyltransferase-isomerase